MKIQFLEKPKKENTWQNATKQGNALKVEIDKVYDKKNNILKDTLLKLLFKKKKKEELKLTCRESWN